MSRCDWQPVQSDIPECPTISFLSRLFTPKNADGSGARVCVGAFGKHPGWNDHIDDQGLETQLLVDFKTLMYIEGMSAAIDSGKWDALGASGQAIAFGHAFLMRSRGEVLVGRLWASADGKGRSKYPMVVVAQCSGMGVEWAVEHALPALEGVQRACQGATTAAAVVEILDRARAELRVGAAGVAGAAPEATIPARFVADFAARPEFGPGREGFDRVIYQVDREMEGFLLGRAPSSKLWRVDAPQARAHHLRVPALGKGEGVGASLLGWTRLLLTKVSPWAPMLLIAPTEHPWVDVIVGEPAGVQMLCIRSSDKAAPLASAIPYTLDAAFLDTINKWISESEASGSRDISVAEARPKWGGGSGASGGGAGSGRFMAPISAAGLIALAMLGSAADAQAQAATAPSAIAEPSGAMESVRQAWRAELARRLGGATPAFEAAAKEADAFIADVEARVPGAIDRAGIADAPWIAALDAEARARRERTLRRLADGWAAAVGVVDFSDPGVQGDVAEAAAEQSRWLARATALARDMARAESLLNAGRSFDETADGSSVARIASRWNADPIMRDAALNRAVAPMRERIDALVAVEAQTDAKALTETVMQGLADRPELALGAWRRLGVLRASPTAPLWPASVSDLETEAALRAPVQRAIATIADGPRQKALGEELRAEQSRRFLRFLSHADDAESMEAGLRLAPGFGVTPEQLDPRIRFNLALIELKRQVTGAGSAMSDAAAKEAVDSFLTSVEALPGGVAYLGDAQAVLITLRELVAGKQPLARALEVTKQGPAKTGAWVGSADGAVVRFKPAPEHSVPALEFVPVHDGSDGSVTYIATTELSVAQAAAIATARGEPSELERVLPKYDPRDDPRQGPRSWQWGVRGRGATASAKVIVPARSWLTHATVDDASLSYPPGQMPAGPAGADPMQQLSPGAAVYLANLAGCRLPTVAEWQAARIQYVPEVRLDACNLRDLRWRRQQEFVDRRIEAGRPAQAADAGAFLPPGLAPVGSRAERSHPWDDGVLWFAPVNEGAGDRVHHLIGNVAEWVLDGDAAAPDEATGAAAKAMVNRQADRLRVIGGSALSEPEIDPLVASKADLAEAQEGYADVGVRLAFSAETLEAAMPLAAKVARVLTPLRVLPPK